MFKDRTRLATHHARAFLRPLRPYDLLGASRIRLGRAFDGGYVMLDCFEGVRTAYSLGINDDVSWDFDMAMRGIDIFQYDHTVTELPFEHERFHWEKIEISHQPKKGMASIGSLIEKNGHQPDSNMVLKCDIEGGEWLTLCYTPNAVLAQFSQIVIELHNLDGLNDPNFAHTARQVALNLTASHRVVNVHANNYSGFHDVGGIPVPQAIELTLMRKDMGDFVPSTRNYPADDDMPCDPLRADLFLGRFEF